MIELPLIIVGPLFAHVMGSVSGTRCEIDEKWNVRFGRLLLTDPAYRLLGDRFGEMPLRFIVRRLNGRSIFEELRIPLIRLSSLEAIEIIEPFACGPAIIWSTECARLTEADIVKQYKQHIRCPWRCCR